MSQFSVHSRFVLLAGMTILASMTAYGQIPDLTDLTNWTQLVASSVPAGETGAISASAPVKGLSGARITATMGCVRKGKHDDLTEGAIWPSRISFHFSLTGNLLDTRDKPIDDMTRCEEWESYSTFDGYPVTRCVARPKIPEHHFYFVTAWDDSPANNDLTINDLHRFNYWTELTPNPWDGPGYYFGEYYVSFHSAETEIKLHISPKTPAVAKFLNQCGRPNEMQAEIIAHERPNMARKAAEETAAAASEAARKYAFESATRDANAPIRNNPALANGLGLGPAPPSSIVEYAVSYDPSRIESRNLRGFIQSRDDTNAFALVRVVKPTKLYHGYVGPDLHLFAPTPWKPGEEEHYDATNSGEVEPGTFCIVLLKGSISGRPVGLAPAMDTRGTFKVTDTTGECYDPYNKQRGNNPHIEIGDRNLVFVPNALDWFNSNQEARDYMIERLYTTNALPM